MTHTPCKYPEHYSCDVCTPREVSMSFPVLDIVGTAFDSKRMPHLDFVGSDETSEAGPGVAWLANLRTGNLITVRLTEYFVPDGAVRFPFTSGHDMTVCVYGGGPCWDCTASLQDTPF